MAPEREASRSGELILNTQQYAFVQDTSKGHLFVYVGPHAATVNEQPVRWDGQRFTPCQMAESIKEFPYVDEQSYAILTNPAKNGYGKRPDPSSKSVAIDLNSGRKIVVPGPAHFPLWPGESVQIITGHVLRSNQYLVALVTNGDEATLNWSKAVLKPQTNTSPSAPTGGEESKPNDSGSGSDQALGLNDSQQNNPKFVTGQRIIIRGTEYSFFIPPTGVEVIPEEKNYVRDAVTLESMQYCVLLSEIGEKRYVQGPAVVFPQPTETFIKDNNSKYVFKAIELNPQMGIHLKVIRDYQETDGQTVRAGEEIFLTGKNCKIYYPRSEHAIVPYRDAEQIHFAVVVPNGEARYVLDKATGKVETVRGPKMLLPSPITNVIVRRALTEREVKLWFPGNEAAERLNAMLRSAMEAKGSEYLSDQQVRSMDKAFAATLKSEDRVRMDELQRRSSYTPPKSITIDTRYEGAVSINVWPGYAVQVVSKSGARETVVGPANVLLDFDQTLAVLELSTGTPKSEKNPKLSTVYLRVMGNKVSDEVKAETADMVEVTLRISYRVNFTGEKSTWFSIEDYVGFLTDHLRSVIRNVIKGVGIEEFNRNAINIVRNNVLGAPVEGARRAGKHFEENGMHVYDLEVLDAKIGDDNIRELLRKAERESVQAALNLQSERRKFEITQAIEKIARATAAEKATTAIETKNRELEIAMAIEEINRSIAAEKTETSIAAMQNAINEVEKRLEKERAELEIEFKKTEERLKAEGATQNVLDELSGRKLAREKAAEDQRHIFEQARQDLNIAFLQAEATATKDRFAAIAPELVKALEAFGDKDLVTKVAAALKTIPMGLDEGMGEVMERVFKGTVLENVISKMKDQNDSRRLPLADKTIS